MIVYQPPTREQIYAAMFSLMQTSPFTAPLFKTYTRRLRSWQQVASEEKPLLAQLQADEEPVSDRMPFPYNVRMKVEEYVFVDQNDEEEYLAPLLNNLVDAVESAIKPVGALEFQTLSNLTDPDAGIVYNVRWKGTSYHDGLLGVHGYAVVLVEIFTSLLDPDIS